VSGRPILVDVWVCIPLQVEAALMYDAVHTVVNAIRQLQRARPGPTRLRVANLSCDDLRAWSHGSSLYNFINMASISSFVGSQ